MGKIFKKTIEETNTMSERPWANLIVDASFEAL